MMEMSSDDLDSRDAAADGACELSLVSALLSESDIVAVAHKLCRTALMSSSKSRAAMAFVRFSKHLPDAVVASKDTLLEILRSDAHAVVKALPTVAHAAVQSLPLFNSLVEPVQELALRSDIPPGLTAAFLSAIAEMVTTSERALAYCTVMLTQVQRVIKIVEEGQEIDKVLSTAVMTLVKTLFRALTAEYG